MQEIQLGSMEGEEFLHEYKESVFELNENQEEAVCYGEGPLYLVAGPGTGKSEVMVARALKLILVDGVAPGSIFLTTFTHKAAKSLEDRLEERLANMGYRLESLEDLRVGTLHSLADEVMREYRYPAYSETRLLDNDEQKFFVHAHSDWVSDAPDEFWDYFDYLHPYASNDYGPNKWQKTKTLVTLFNRVLDNEVSVDRLRDSGIQELEQLADAVTEYHAKLEENHRTDYSHMLVMFREFLSTQFGETFIEGDDERGLVPLKYVLVDEYQDTNPLQESIYFRLAAQSGGNITVVGDDDQALYRFRGGTVECIVRFPQMCSEFLNEEPEKVQLRKSYRFVSEIRDWFDQLVDAQPAMQLDGARVDKEEIQAVRGSAGLYPAVTRVRGGTYAEAGETAAGIIEELLDKGIVEDPSQIAVLLKSARENNTNAGPIAGALRDRNIPVYNPRSKDFLETTEVAAMLGGLLEIVDEDNEVGETLQGRVTDSIAEWRAEYQAVAQAYPQLQAFVEKVHSDLEDQPKGENLNVSLRDYFYRLLSLEPFSEWQRHPIRSRRLGELSSVLESYAAVQEYSDDLRMSTTEEGQFSWTWVRWSFYHRLIRYLHNTDLDHPEDPDYEILPGAVQIMTVHQAKGLEFPVVFVDSLRMQPDSEGDTYQLEEELNPHAERPRNLFPSDERAVQDLVRQFYVAYSRAENLLVLFGTDDNYDDAEVSIAQEVGQS